MTYAAILVHAQADPAGERRLACACDLARRFDATLIGLGAETVRPMIYGPGGSALQGQWVAAMMDLARKNLESARAAFTAAAAGLPRAAIWEQGLDLPGPSLALASRSADIIVASNPAAERADAYIHASAADLVLTSGRPVLVAPAAAPPLVAQRIVLAWKDTREARRAMTDALPLLKRAEAVTVVEICNFEDAADAAIRTGGVVEALVRHGVRAQAEVLTDRGEHGVELLSHAKSLGADLLVAGAYGHNRFGEWAFGGVTRDLLGQDEAYLLLSH